jgi:hypothetical protein
MTLPPVSPCRALWPSLLSYRSAPSLLRRQWMKARLTPANARDAASKRSSAEPAVCVGTAQRWVVLSVRVNLPAPSSPSMRLRSPPGSVSCSEVKGCSRVRSLCTSLSA